jgi:hypothetical protein
MDKDHKYVSLRERTIEIVKDEHDGYLWSILGGLLVGTITAILLLCALRTLAYFIRL